MGLHLLNISAALTMNAHNMIDLALHPAEEGE
jgi:hypothetical protein